MSPIAHPFNPNTTFSDHGSPCIPGPIGRGVLYALLICFCSAGLWAQLSPGVYTATLSGQQRELKVTDNYLVYTSYAKSPPAFHKTYGGFYRLEGGFLMLQLEFNSEFETDGVREMSVPLKAEGNSILWGANGQMFKRQDEKSQALDGLWLFATRGPDTGQERRGEENSRKTLKFLKDGRFQWIAYDTESMNFSGTGGGRYTASDGTYTEHIEFFSRDNARVGATLEFSYELQGPEWHHKGQNSLGEPMYEIWAKREIGQE